MGWDFSNGLGIPARTNYFWFYYIDEELYFPLFGCSCNDRLILRLISLKVPFIDIYRFLFLYNVPPFWFQHLNLACFNLEKNQFLNRFKLVLFYRFFLVKNSNLNRTGNNSIVSIMRRFETCKHVSNLCELSWISNNLGRVWDGTLS